jgi:hypothetical protein
MGISCCTQKQSKVCESLASFGANASALLSGNFLPFLAGFGKGNRDRLFAAFHLAALAAAPALGAAAFVAVHLATDFLTRATGILSSALLSHLGSPLQGTKMVGGFYGGMRRKLKPSIKIQPARRRWRVRQAEEDEMDEALLGLGTEKDGSSEK